MESFDKRPDQTGPDQKAAAESSEKLRREAAELMAKRAPQAERPATAKLHPVELTDERTARKEALREKAGRTSEDKGLGGR